MSGFYDVDGRHVMAGSPPLDALVEMGIVTQEERDRRVRAFREKPEYILGVVERLWDANQALNNADATPRAQAEFDDSLRTLLEARTYYASKGMPK